MNYDHVSVITPLSLDEKWAIVYQPQRVGAVILEVRIDILNFASGSFADILLYVGIVDSDQKAETMPRLMLGAQFYPQTSQGMNPRPIILGVWPPEIAPKVGANQAVAIRAGNGNGRPACSARVLYGQ